MSRRRSETQWGSVWRQFAKHRLGMIAFVVTCLFLLVGLYAPFLASSKPIAVHYDGQWYFPLFRYLFYRGFYTKPIDLFYNVLMFTFPLFLLAFWLLRGRVRRWTVAALVVVQLGLSIAVIQGQPHDPAASPPPVEGETWSERVAHLPPYAKLNMIVQNRTWKEQHDRFSQYVDNYSGKRQRDWAASQARAEQRHLQAEGVPDEELPSLQELEARFFPLAKNKPIPLPTKWQMAHDHKRKKIERLGKAGATREVQYLEDRQEWIEKQNEAITFLMMPLIRPFHWEDDAGGQQSLNKYVKWWDLTRLNRKDLVASLIFGVRVSLVVGVTAVALSLLIAIPLGAAAGYFGGRTDMVLSRIIEIWEAMPTFFMLLMVVAVLQNKSIFLVVAVLGLFGWTGMSRFLRAEILKQRNLAYVEGCRSLGFKSGRIIFRHVLPNAIPPLLTLIPFSMMAAITAEAGISFLGLGEEGSASWGVLMDEGRVAFPGESYLLWPPALLLTLFLVAIAIVGDAMRDALDPKMRA